MARWGDEIATISVIDYVCGENPRGSAPLDHVCEGSGVSAVPSSGPTNLSGGVLPESGPTALSAAANPATGPSNLSAEISEFNVGTILTDQEFANEQPNPLPPTDKTFIKYAKSESGASIPFDHIFIYDPADAEWHNYAADE